MKLERRWKDGREPPTRGTSNKREAEGRPACTKAVSLNIYQPLKPGFARITGWSACLRVHEKKISLQDTRETTLNIITSSPPKPHRATLIRCYNQACKSSKYKGSKPQLPAKKTRLPAQPSSATSTNDTLQAELSSSIQGGFGDATSGLWRKLLNELPSVSKADLGLQASPCTLLALSEGGENQAQGTSRLES